MPAKDENLEGNCICARCPTYAECVRRNKKLLFCFEDKAGCPLERYGCVCGACPVQRLRGFSGVYFCIEGKVRIK